MEKALVPAVSEDTNSKLTLIQTPKEIKDAMFSIHVNNAPGLMDSSPPAGKLLDLQ